MICAEFETYFISLLKTSKYSFIIEVQGGSKLPFVKVGKKMPLTQFSYKLLYPLTSNITSQSIFKG